MYKSTISLLISSVLLPYDRWISHDASVNLAAFPNFAVNMLTAGFYRDLGRTCCKCSRCVTQQAEQFNGTLYITCLTDFPQVYPGLIIIHIIK